jgi:plastocyanin
MRHLALNVGDTVRFKKQDPFIHDAFSLSEVKTFDFGSYPQRQSRIVTLDKPGTVEVECTIHPGMKMEIDVQK